MIMCWNCDQQMHQYGQTRYYLCYQCDTGIFTYNDAIEYIISSEFVFNNKHIRVGAFYDHEYKTHYIITSKYNFKNFLNDDIMVGSTNIVNDFEIEYNCKKPNNQQLIQTFKRLMKAQILK